MFCVVRRSSWATLANAIREVRGDAALQFSSDTPVGDRHVIEAVIRRFSDMTIRYIYVLPEEIYDGMTFAALFGQCQTPASSFTEEFRRRCEEYWESGGVTR